MLRSLPACSLAFLIGCTAIRPLDAPLDASSDRDAQQSRIDASAADSGVPGSDASTDACGSAPELCNGADDDCDPSSTDGSEDPTVGTPCDGPDADSCAEGTSSCAGGAVACDDATGDTVEVCSGASGGTTTGADEDCDGSVDEDGAQGSHAYYPDADSDGYGSDTGVRMACTMPTEGRWQTRGGDCDDADPDVRPGRAEQCNGADDDCDGMIDDSSPCDGCQTFYYGTSTYQICTRTELPWSMARTGCMLGGYDLAVLGDSAEDAALSMEAQRVGGFNDEFWFGLSRMTAGGEYAWVDGSPLTYTHWASGEPNLATGCVRFTRLLGTGWYDADCSQSHDFICELPAAP